MRPSSLLLAALTLPGVAACASSGSAAPEPEPYYGALLDQTPETSFGYYLTELDARLRAWSNYKLTGTSREDKRTLRLLEQELRRTTRERLDELVATLETGVPKNRNVAAMALGFTGDEDAQSALLSVLSESSDDELVGNALLGLGLLGLDDTPLAQVCWLLGSHPDPFTRSNAAFCLQRLVAAGAEDDCVADECINALVDQEPGVRAQAASVLGLLVHSDAVDELDLLLGDPEALVVAASARALARIGREDPHSKGDAARALVGALERVPRSLRGAVTLELVYLAEANYGDEVDAWRDWAYRLD